MPATASSDPYASLAATVAADRQRLLDWRDKAVIPQWYGLSIAEASGATRLSQLSTPMLTLDAARIASNIAEMQRWCDDRGLSLAPHGKTTMAPALWLQQLQAGSWAITVANEAQLRVALGSGVPRIMLANMLLRADALAWLATELDADPTLEVYCWADSLAAVELMTTALAEAGASCRLPVLVELGKSGSRTGARSIADAVSVAQAIVASPALSFAGVAGYEGAIDSHVDRAGLDNVDGYLTGVLHLFAAVSSLVETRETILTLGGSTYFDRVAEAVAPIVGKSVRVVLRSGAYLAHDDGLYRDGTPSTRTDGPQLLAAMGAWARVISTPERRLALLDAGRRDLPFDQGMPVVQGVRTLDGDYRALGAGYTVTKLNDQHAFVEVPPDSVLAVGDVVKLGLSHPCTAFDKWALIPVLDDSTSVDPLVVDVIPTYF